MECLPLWIREELEESESNTEGQGTIDAEESQLEEVVKKTKSIKKNGCIVLANLAPTSPRKEMSKTVSNNDICISELFI